MPGMDGDDERKQPFQSNKSELLRFALQQHLLRASQEDPLHPPSRTIGAQGPQAAALLAPQPVSFPSTFAANTSSLAGIPSTTSILGVPPPLVAPSGSLLASSSIRQDAPLPIRHLRHLQFRGISRDAQLGVAPLPFTTNRAVIKNVLDDDSSLHANHHHPPRIDTARQQQALLQMEPFIRCMPARDVEDYWMARRLVPRLLLTESDPVRFLRVVNYNAQFAAKRMVQYWKQRREIFGTKAWLLPLTLMEHGALSQQDMDVIKAGHSVFLPHDDQGRTVCCWDSSRRLQHEMETRMRVAFYVGQILSENPKSQTDGFVSVVCSNSPTKYDGGTQRILDLLLSAFPIKVQAWHFFNITTGKESPNNKRPALEGTEDIIVDDLILKFSSFFCQYQTHLYTVSSKQKIAEEMKKHGILPAGLPRSLGGTWSYQNLISWLVNRVALEREQLGLGDAASSKPALHQESTTSPDLSNYSAAVFLQDYRRLVQAAMQQIIPPLDQSAYQEAMALASEQIHQKEANMDWFLFVEDLNCSLTAKRMASYWQLRLGTFGEKRHLPLNQTGEGALKRKELAVLGTGFVNLLPNDNEGCPVLWIDSSRLEQEKQVSDVCRDRCLFYMFSLLAENELSQNTGATLLYMVDNPVYHVINIQFLQRLAECLPIRFKALHLVSFCSVPALLKSKFQFGDETYVHVAATKADLAAKLEVFELNRSGMPKRVGGTWGYEKFVHWQELRARLEFNIPAALSGRHVSTEPFEYPAIRPYTLLPASEKMERNRRMNLIHSRRKRDRERIEIEVLREHCAELREEHQKLSGENRVLEDTLRYAMEFTEQYGVPILD